MNDPQVLTMHAYNNISTSFDKEKTFNNFQN